MKKERTKPWCVCSTCGFQETCYDDVAKKSDTVTL